MDIVCFANVKWSFYYERPQHIFGLLAGFQRVFYIEEPIYASSYSRPEYRLSSEEVIIVTPYITGETGSAASIAAHHKIIDEVWSDYQINDFVLWYYSPKALTYTRHLQSKVTVYDWKVELNGDTEPALEELETELLSKADVVFTSGHTLFQAKRTAHPNIHPFPDSIEKEHFQKARKRIQEPPDQLSIPYPRIGFSGVIDERLDLELIEEIAVARPDWQLVLVGAVINIDPALLPLLPNIHYLGFKSYHELPDYISGWQITMMPYVLNNKTRYTSPAETNGFLAAGKPVISTAISDIVFPYGEMQLVNIIDGRDQFIKKAIEILDCRSHLKWLKTVDSFLKNNSWENTCFSMNRLVNERLAI